MKKVLICMLGIFVCFAVEAQQKSMPDAEDNFLSQMLASSVFSMDKEQKVSDLQWNPHASFKGVYLKHLITGKGKSALFLPIRPIK